MNCPSCESEKISHERLPEHKRQWRDGPVEHNEYMPAATHHECHDCGKQWTDYDNDQ